jgi:hypothetical protein
MVPPTSVEPLASNVQAPAEQVTENEAVGIVATTVTDFDRVPTSPASSVTDNVTA